METLSLPQNDSSYKTKIQELIDDIQTGGDKYFWDLYRDFPENMKGYIAKKFWDRHGLDGSEMITTHPHEAFTYGAEYGALIILNHFRNQSSPTTVREVEE